MDNARLIAALQQIKSLAEDCIRAAGADARKQQVPKSKPVAHPSASAGLDFGKPLRPFIKTYRKGLSGPKKFTLLVSWLCKGDANKQIALSEVEKQWNKMTTKSLLGMKFNRFFPAAARTNDWVESKKQGMYSLRPDWRDALRGKA